MRLRLVRLLGVTAICLGALGAPAQARSEWVIARMGNVVRADVTWEQVRSQMLVAFYRSNPGERGVGPQGVEDIDGDGVITAAEIRQEAQKQTDQAGLGWQQNATQRVPMTLDADGDRAVSLAEYEAAVRELFGAIDQDRDGRVSAGELADFGKRLDEAGQAEPGAREAQAQTLRFKAAETTMKDDGAREMTALLPDRAADEIGGEPGAATFRVPAARPDLPVGNAIALSKEAHNAIDALKEGRGEMPSREVQEDYAAGIAQIELSKEARNAVDAPKEGRGEMLSGEAQEDYAAGIAQIDAEPVIAAQPVTPDTVRPGRAAVAEFVDAGSPPPE